MTGDDFTRRVEAEYQRYFAEHERLWEQAPPELDDLPRAESLLLEMVIDDWLRSRRKALAPLECLLARLEEGVDPNSELGEALAEATVEFERDPEGFRAKLERHLDEAEMNAGDLGYAIGIARCGAALEAGQQTRAIGFLNRATNRDWEKAFCGIAKKLRVHVQRDDVPHEVLSAVWQVIHEAAKKGVEGRGGRYRNQRAALATAISHTIYDDLGGKRKPRRDTPGKAEAFATPDADPAPTEGGTGLSLEEELTLQLLLEKANNLSKREEEALILRYVEGLEGKALGEALGTAPVTARGHIRNAIKKIQKLT